jgi:hypothetical protein
MDDNFDLIDFEDYSDYWVSYFDLLGFSELVNTRKYFDVWESYSKAFKQLEDYNPYVDISWFSDSFIFYSSNDGPDSFSSIEGVSRSFIHYLILRRIPVRGALSFGRFYANKKYNIFFGPALIDAYHYGEAQDWIGFILTPSTIEQMDKIGLPAKQRIHYAYWDIPFKLKGKEKTLNLPAYIIEGYINNRNLCLEKLQQIRNSLINSNDYKYVKKYENTIKFLEEND